jgi:lipoprotein-releasing system ATP-binding protein
MAVALSATDIAKSYPSPGGDLVVLAGVSLHLTGGEAAAIVGPSGSGKSTLLHILGGLDAPTSGELEVNGERPFKMSPTELAKYRNRTVGFVFQDHHLLPQCTVVENVLLPALADKGVTPALETRARELLDRVGLSHRLTHRPGEISGGERQRAAIARALVNRPSLLLCDEPTGNLDKSSAGVAADVLLELGRQPDVMLLVVTHSLELAGRLPRRFEIDAGRLVEQR